MWYCGLAKKKWNPGIIYNIVTKDHIAMHAILFKLKVAVFFNSLLV